MSNYRQYPQNAKASYQPWSEEEFQADLDVQQLSPLEKWMYRTLLQQAWVASSRPRLPDDDAVLWKLAGCQDQDQWETYKTAVRAMFQAVEIDGVALLERKRLNHDWDALVAKRIKRMEAGHKSVEVRDALAEKRAQDRQQRVQAGYASGRARRAKRMAAEGEGGGYTEENAQEEERRVKKSTLFNTCSNSVSPLDSSPHGNDMGTAFKSRSNDPLPPPPLTREWRRS